MDRRAEALSAIPDLEALRMRLLIDFGIAITAIVARATTSRPEAAPDALAAVLKSARLGELIS